MKFTEYTMDVKLTISAFRKIYEKIALYLSGFLNKNNKKRNADIAFYYAVWYTYHTERDHI